MVGLQAPVEPSKALRASGRGSRSTCRSLRRLSSNGCTSLSPRGRPTLSGRPLVFHGAASANPNMQPSDGGILRGGGGRGGGGWGGWGRGARGGLGGGGGSGAFGGVGRSW